MSSPAKVLLLVENNSYPFDFRVRREAHALRDAGYQVSVIAPRGPAQPWIEDVEGISVYRFPAPPGGAGVISYAFEFGYATLVMLLLTAWVAMRKGIDVIHAANPPDTLFVIGAIFKLFGKRFVFDQHDLASEIYLSRFERPRTNLIYKILRILERCSYATADVVVATNESYKQMALNRGNKHLDKVFIVRNGPPLAYKLLEPDPDLVLKAKYLIGYIGTIGPQDGVDYWLRAIREMVFTLGRRDFLAIIIGSGDALSSVQALAKELQIEAHVLFTGRLSELESRKYLSAVNVCVQPDPLSPLNDKSTMNKLMEYMALGKPTVAFDLVETRFSAQEAAIYVQPNDELEFAERVSWLLDNPDECEKMGKIGRDRVANALAWEYSVPVLLQAYSEGLGLPLCYLSNLTVNKEP
ncbi:glycosyltransferase family 4 protein [Methylobacter sp. BlB1]|uniref:glycosyltransferase family 4 protein n=1 Tax=Methylobacter sp. BlB1 TaxID=2785914 RepID=UPI001893770C|nr:glycosyltransferase family 4 protein [Methylobacter sp. BlB1]MBF6651149.1 glycosyltransferase family 4 protein [Methylobacter sp. BlB1]